MLGRAIQLLVTSFAVVVGAGAAAEPAVLVMIGEEVRVDASQELYRAIASQVGDLETELVLRWVGELPAEVTQQRQLAAEIATQESATVVFWCDLSETGQLSFYLGERAASPHRTREVASAGSEAGSRFEAIALIVRATVEALRAVEETPTEDLSIAEAESEPEPESEPEREAEIESVPEFESQPRFRPTPILGADYALHGMATQQRVRHRIEVRLGLHVSRRWSVVASYSLGPGVGVQAEGISLSDTVHDIQVGLAFDHPEGILTLGGRIAAAVELHAWDARSEATEVEAMEESTAVGAGASLEFRLGLRIGRGLHLRTGPGLVLWFANPSFGVRIDGETRTILEPWPAQPYWFVGLVGGVP